MSQRVIMMNMSFLMILALLVCDKAPMSARVLGKSPPDASSAMIPFTAELRRGPGQPVDPAARLGQALTRREQEVLALLVNGLTNAEIAERLAISRTTVKVHVSHILSKLDVSSREEAISLAIQHGLIS